MTQTIDNKLLFKAINKWESTAPIELLLNFKVLKSHMVSEHGIEMESWIGLGAPKIVDEKKFVLFLLKFS